MAQLERNNLLIKLTGNIPTETYIINKYVTLTALFTWEVVVD